MEKILITGTGRCGTTFLILLFSFLEFDTGYNRENYLNNLNIDSKAGLEQLLPFTHYISKRPDIILNIELLIKNINIKQVIIPIRDYTLSAQSRVNNKYIGGLWYATTEEEQITFYKHIMSEYMYIATKYDINTLFLDFDRMINNKKYLFDKLKHILDEKHIEFEHFSTIYDEVTLILKK